MPCGLLFTRLELLYCERASGYQIEVRLIQDRG